MVTMPASQAPLPQSLGHKFQGCVWQGEAKYPTKKLLQPEALRQGYKFTFHSIRKFVFQASQTVSSLGNITEGRDCCVQVWMEPVREGAGGCNDLPTVCPSNTAEP